MTTAELSRVDAAIEHAKQQLSQAVPIIEQFRNEYMGITVTGPDDEAGAQTARVALDRVKRARLETEKTRKALKADSNRYGKTVDGEARRIRGMIEPIEEHLQEQYDIVRLEKARREAEAQRQRDQQIQDWVGQLSSVGGTVDLQALKLMDEHDFHFHFKNVETKWKEANAERQAEQAKLEEEQARLRSEREHLGAERAELQKLRDEQRQREEAEELQRREADEAERLAALEPVRKQLEGVGKLICATEIPEALDEYRADIRVILCQAAYRITGLAR